MADNIASITCSIDGGEEENCTLPLMLTAAEVGLGEHTVAFTLTDVCGDTAQSVVNILWDGPLPPPGKKRQFCPCYCHYNLMHVPVEEFK